MKASRAADTEPTRTSKRLKEKLSSPDVFTPTEEAEAVLMASAKAAKWLHSQTVSVSLASMTRQPSVDHCALSRSQKTHTGSTIVESSPSAVKWRKVTRAGEESPRWRPERPNEAVMTCKL